MNFRHLQWVFIHSNSRDVDHIRAKLHGPIDVLLIGGDHSYGGCLADLVNYVPLVRPGGIVLVHDVAPTIVDTPEMLAVGWPCPGLRLAFDLFVRENWLDAQILPGIFGMGVFTVPKGLEVHDCWSPRGPEGPLALPDTNLRVANILTAPKSGSK